MKPNKFCYKCGAELVKTDVTNQGCSSYRDERRLKFKLQCPRYRWWHIVSCKHQVSYVDYKGEYASPPITFLNNGTGNP